MSIGIKKRIKGYFDLIRPFTLLAPLIVSICIMLASFFYAGRTDDLFTILWKTIIPASFALAILNGASNTLNQVTDINADKISKSYRPIPRGDISIAEAKIISLVLYVVAVTLSLFVNVMFTLFVLLIVMFTVTYSLPPRMKKYLFINQIWIAIPRGMLGILASWSVFGNPFTPTPLIIGGIATTYLVGGMATKDITDAEADKKTGIKTLINTYGSEKTALITFPFMFFPFVFIPIFIHQNGIEGYLWALTFLVLLTFLIFYFTIKKTVSSTLENIHAWSIMYVQYIIFAMAFSLLTIYSDILPL